MSDEADLKYGETPWDNLPRETLLREVQRMYAAIISLNSALRLCRANDRGGFWSVPGDGMSSTDRGGTGGHALEMARSIIEPLHEQHESENIYRAFFRYAVDLLFSPSLGFSWTACNGCKVFLGDEGQSPEHRSLDKPCPECARHNRHFIRRRLEWRDLQPAQKDSPHV